MENIEKIKDRISKLLAMAGDTSSPEEAAIAAARARKLMDKYQLDSWDITSSDAAIYIKSRADKDYKFMPSWRGWLSVAVAKYNDCIAAREGSEKGGYSHLVFKGEANDVKLATDMYKTLADACEAQCKTYMEANGHASYYVAKVGDAFKKGFSMAITAKINGLCKEREEEFVSTGTSLVVVKMAGVEQHFGQANYTSSKTKMVNEEAVRHAYGQGHVRGQAHEVNKAVSG